MQTLLRFSTSKFREARMGKLEPIAALTCHCSFWFARPKCTCFYYLGPSLAPPVLLDDGFSVGALNTSKAAYRPIAQLVLSAFALKALAEHHSQPAL